MAHRALMAHIPPIRRIGRLRRTFHPHGQPFPGTWTLTRRQRGQSPYQINGSDKYQAARRGTAAQTEVSDRVRKPVSIRNGYADRQKEEIRVLYRQCPGEEDQSV